MSPDHRKHQGAHPEDKQLFAQEQLIGLRTAVREMAWLLERGYPSTASLKLVGDHHRLNERQRTALLRATCSDTSRRKRIASCLSPEQIFQQDIQIDGFNLLITIEAALGGGLLLVCRDGCLRDLASIHSTYKTVEETIPALLLIGETLNALQPNAVQWLLDSPVSNSGRLAQTLRDLAAERDWPWQVETVFNPDTVLKASEQIVITSDSVILDAARRWVHLSAYVISQHVPDAWVVDLSDNETDMQSSEDAEALK